MPVVNREIVLPVDRERAWELITEPAELEEWLADEVEFEPEERIVFRWGDSRVEWALEDHPAGTRCLVTEHRHAADSLVWGPRLMALSAASMLCPA